MKTILLLLYKISFRFHSIILLVVAPRYIFILEKKKRPFSPIIFNFTKKQDCQNPHIQAAKSDVVVFRCCSIFSLTAAILALNGA